MTRIGVNIVDEEINNGSSLEDAGNLLLAFTQDQLERGGLSIQDSAYRAFPEYREYIGSLPRPSAFKSTGVDDMANRYADVPRGTIDREGVVETNGRHAVHLMGFAVPYAMRYYPELNPALIAVNTLVHDFPEVINGDLPTFGMPNEDYEKKVRDEIAGLPELGRLLGPGHRRLFGVIRDYESQRTPEQRFTRQIDKIDPYFTHLENGAIQLDTNYPIKTVEDFYRLSDITTQRIAQYPGRLDLLVEDRDVTIERLAKIGDWPSEQ